MQKEVREAFRIHFKWTVLEYAKVCRTVAKACREFEVPRSTIRFAQIDIVVVVEVPLNDLPDEQRKSLDNSPDTLLEVLYFL